LGKRGVLLCHFPKKLKQGLPRFRHFLVKSMKQKAFAGVKHNDNGNNFAKQIIL